jgi:trigger factor
MENVQSSVEDVNAVTKKISFTIPAMDIDKRWNDEIVKLTRTAKINGFRPGKAPRQMIEQLHGKAARIEVKERLVGDALRSKMQELDLNYVGSPSIKFSEKGILADGDLEFTAEIALYPKPEKVTSEKLSVALPKFDVKEEDVSNAVDYIRKTRATSRPIEGRDVAQAGDLVSISYVTTVNGKKITETPERPQAAVLSADTFAQHIFDGIVGLKVGETRSVPMIDPAKQKEKKEGEGLEANTTFYEITLEKIEEQLLPELDDAFVASLNEEGIKTALELKLKIRERLEKTAADERFEVAKPRLLKALGMANDFLVPQLMIDHEIYQLFVRHRLIDSQKLEFSRFNVTPFRERLNEIASRNVRAAVALEKIVEDDGIRATPEELDAWTEKFAQNVKMSVEETREMLSRSGSLENVMRQISHDKALQGLLEKAKVELVDKDTTETDEETKILHDTLNALFPRGEKEQGVVEEAASAS